MSPLHVDRLERGFQSAARNGEDVLLWRAFSRSPIRRYVDAAGPDPLGQSMSWAFHATGWRGLIVTPSPAHHRMLSVSRPGAEVVLAVAGREDGMAIVYVDHAATIATRDPSLAEQYGRAGLATTPVEIAIRPCGALTRDWGEPAVDFLVVAADGHEMDCLAGADLSVFRPRVIALRGGDASPSVVSSLADARYRKAGFVGLHAFFIAEEAWEDLGSCFSLPPHSADEGISADRHPTLPLVEIFEHAFAAHRDVWQRVISAEREVFRSRSSVKQLRHQVEMELNAKQLELVRINTAAELAISDVKQLQLRLQEVYSSTSWRIARPVRVLSRILQSLQINNKPAAKVALAPEPLLPTVGVADVISSGSEVESAMTARLEGSVPKLDLD